MNAALMSRFIIIIFIIIIVVGVCCVRQYLAKWQCSDMLF